MLELRERRRVPVVAGEVAELELREDVVEDAVLEVRHPVPDLHRDDDRHRPDEHERRREEDPHEAAETRTSSSASSVPSTIVRPTFDDREDGRPQQRVPEDRVVQDRAVVGEADRLALVLDQLEQPVLLEREPDEAVDRVAEHRADRHEHREDQPVGNRGAERAAPRRSATPPRPRGRGLGGDRYLLRQGATSRSEPRRCCRSRSWRPA